MIHPRVMPDYKIGSTHQFEHLRTAYNADPQQEDDAHFLLWRGEEILALCLRHKYNPKPDEVWVGNAEAVARWGERLAALKGKQTVPLYYSPRSRTLFEYRGQQLITGESVDPKELTARKGPVPLSRIVYLKGVTGS